MVEMDTVLILVVGSSVTTARVWLSMFIQLFVLGAYHTSWPWDVARVRLGGKPKRCPSRSVVGFDG